MFRVLIAALIAVAVVAFGPATPRVMRAKVEMSMANKVNAVVCVKHSYYFRIKLYL